MSFTTKNFLIHFLTESIITWPSLQLDGHTCSLGFQTLLSQVRDGLEAFPDTNVSSLEVCIRDPKETSFQIQVLVLSSTEHCTIEFPHLLIYHPLVMSATGI